MVVSGCPFSAAGGCLHRVQGSMIAGQPGGLHLSGCGALGWACALGPVDSVGPVGLVPAVHKDL